MWRSDVVEVLGGSWESHDVPDSYITHCQSSLRVRYHQFHTVNVIMGALRHSVTEPSETLAIFEVVRQAPLIVLI
jgi:hypothetical protein